MNWIINWALKRLGSQALEQSDRARVWQTSKLTGILTVLFHTAFAVTLNRYCPGCFTDAQAAAFGMGIGAWLATKEKELAGKLIESIGHRDVVADGPKPPEPDLSAPVPDLPEVAAVKP